MEVDGSEVERARGTFLQRGGLFGTLELWALNLASRLPASDFPTSPSYLLPLSGASLGLLTTSGLTFHLAEKEEEFPSSVFIHTFFSLEPSFSMSSTQSFHLCLKISSNFSEVYHYKGIFRTGRVFLNHFILISCLYK